MSADNGRTSALKPERHWVHWTMRRRLAAIYYHRARALLRPAASQDQLSLVEGYFTLVGKLARESRDQYLVYLLEAFDIIYARVVGLALPERFDALSRLEAKRSLNNILYYASLVCFEPGGAERLENRGFGIDLFRRQLDRLGAQNIDAVKEPDIVHTIGFACHVLGQYQCARNAAERLVKTILEAGDEVSSQYFAPLFADAREWTRAEASGSDHIMGDGELDFSYR